MKLDQNLELEKKIYLIM